MFRRMTMTQESRDWPFLSRIQFGLYSVLGALRATGEWRAINGEMINGAPPATELGRQHAAWLASR